MTNSGSNSSTLPQNNGAGIALAEPSYDLLTNKCKNQMEALPYYKKGAISCKQFPAYCILDTKELRNDVCLRGMEAREPASDKYKVITLKNKGPFQGEYRLVNLKGGKAQHAVNMNKIIYDVLAK